MTTNQQKTIDELQEFYNKINSLESPPYNMMEEIAAELNTAKVRKMKAEASAKAAHSMAFEAMTKYADETVRPILSKFLNSFNVEVNTQGRLWIGAGGRYQSFTIDPVFHEGADKTEFRQTVFMGFKADYRTFTMDLNDFNSTLKKFVIDTAKAIEELYY